VHYLLFYDVVEGYTERRKPFRASHLAYCNEAVSRGELVLGGALGEPTDTALLLFRSPSREAAERFASRDPYVLNGLVKSWRVREWLTVVGPEASVRMTP